jgi:hypothetical protein
MKIHGSGKAGPMITMDVRRADARMNQALIRLTSAGNRSGKLVPAICAFGFSAKNHSDPTARSIVEVFSVPLGRKKDREIVSRKRPRRWRLRRRYRNNGNEGSGYHEGHCGQLAM